jgi:hypothetical protein
VEWLLVIGGFGFATACTVAVVVLRARRGRRAGEPTNANINSQQDIAQFEPTSEDLEARHYAEEEVRISAEARAAGRRATEEARAAAEQEAQRKAEEGARLRAESEAHAAADQEVRRKAEEDARLRAESEARAAALQEARRKIEEDARLRAESEARTAAEQEAQRKAEEDARLRAESEARAASEQEAQRNAEKDARLRAESEARAAAEQEVRRKAEEDARLRAESEARAEAEQEARRKAEEDARLRAESEERAAAEQKAQRSAEEDARLRAESEAHAPEDENPDGKTDDTARFQPSPRAPREYRPSGRVPGGPRRAQADTQQEARDRAAPIEVRVLFERAGFCRVSLLPRRTAAMPIELTVTGSGDPPDLVALQDEWYQDVAVENLGQLLREGIEWAGVRSGGRQFRLTLSGRELYVLARHAEINGFVSSSRLVLGEEHVVLCIPERLSEVRDAIALTGSPEPGLLSVDSGVPPGWVGLRGIIPRIPVVSSSDGNILDALRPLAEVKVSLEEGIRIDRQTWLAGFPPSIRLRGDTSTTDTVVIDGHQASLSQLGGYEVPGWDSPGEHTVWCANAARTYSIRGGAEDWEPWDAYTWSLGEPGHDDAQARPSICGVLVRPPQKARSESRAIVVSAANPILIGAAPGEIEVCIARGDVQIGLCVGFPWFEPIWAIPGDVLHCDKRVARILFIGDQRSVASAIPRQRISGVRGQLVAESRRDHAWCTAVRSAGAKGLQIDPQGSEIVELWQTYKRYAKALAKKMR